MKKIENKTLTILFAAILLVSVGTSTFLVPDANAHTPPRNVQTYSYIALSPDPVGVGQNVIVVYWVSPNPPYSDRSCW